MTTSIPDFILPPSMLEGIGESIDPPKKEEPTSSQIIPEPQGWKILCMVPDVEETFEGTKIVKAESARRSEEIATTVLFVMRVGPLAYKDPAKFPDGKAWCKKGDFILVRTYSGTRFQIKGKEFRLINDDMVEAVVEDPRGVLRIGA